MSVVNEFEASNVKWSPENKRLYVLGKDGARLMYDFDISCRGQKVSFFFDFKSMRCMLVIAQPFSSGYICCVMKFWVERDMPILSTNWMTDQKALLDGIAEEFRHKYATHLIDSMVNS